MATRRRANPFHPQCPSRGILGLIGSKWSMLLLCSLRRAPMRTGALKRELGGISQKMLTQTLRDLERHGIVQRIDFAEVPPRVEYRLTRLGHSLSDRIIELEEWVADNYHRMATMATHFDVEERAAS